jgi:hypothetical protein
MPFNPGLLAPAQDGRAGRFRSVVGDEVRPRAAMSPPDPGEGDEAAGR